MRGGHSAAARRNPGEKGDALRLPHEKLGIRHFVPKNRSIREQTFQKTTFVPKKRQNPERFLIPPPKNRLNYFASLNQFHRKKVPKIWFIL